MVKTLKALGFAREGDEWYYDTLAIELCYSGGQVTINDYLLPGKFTALRLEQLVKAVTG